MIKRKNKILLYQDYVHNNGILYRRLSETYEQVVFCDADDISNGALNSGVYLLVMPGGADLYYCEKLDGAGNSAIRKYVEAGGNYLGICAGAYYAAREIDWDQGKIAGPRELRFFDGQATGPVYEFLEENNIDESWQNIVDINIGGELYPALYYAGPVFDGAGLATYSNGKTAIVKTKIGKGTVILSSPHIEYRPQDLIKVTYKNQNASYNWAQNNIDKFQKRYHAEHDIWSRIMKEFE